MRTATLTALTVMQPWAWAIAQGFKAVENRKWSTKYRGPLAIHAGISQRWIEDGRQFLFDQSCAFDRPEWKMPEEESLDFGAIVAVVDVVDCITLAKLERESRGLERIVPSIPAQQLRAFAGGPCCWILDNVRKLPEPIPCKGAQQLWFVPDDVAAAVHHAIAALTPSVR